MESIRVNGKEYCQSIFSPENLKRHQVQSVLLRQQLPRGFQPDVVCAGNELTAEGACNGNDSFKTSFNALTKFHDLDDETQETADLP